MDAWRCVFLDWSCSPGPRALRRMRPEIVRAGPPACSASGWTTTSTLRGKRDESCMFRRAGSPHGYQPQTGDCPDGRQARDSTPALVVRPTLPGSDGTSSTAERKLGTHFELASGPSHLPDGPARPFGQWSQHLRCLVLGSYMKRRSLPRGTVIFAKGDPGTGLMGVLAGCGEDQRALGGWPRPCAQHHARGRHPRGNRTA
jgi:hypothetical protein